MECKEVWSRRWGPRHHCLFLTDDTYETRSAEKHLFDISAYVFVVKCGLYDRRQEVLMAMERRNRRERFDGVKCAR